MHIPLTLTPPTTMRMITSIHSQTAHSRSNIQPPTPARLPQLPKLPVRITRHADRGTSILTNLPHLPALQANSNFLDLLPHRFLRHHRRVRAGATAENGTAAGVGADAVDLRSKGYHVHGEAVPAERGFRGQHARVYSPSHALDELGWDTGAVAFHRIASAHALGGDYVAFLLRRHILQ